jgi:two-component system, LytTR family, response regulator LytT
MNVLIVENEKKEAARLVRILRLVDPSIIVMKTVADLEAVARWMAHNPTPDIVLVNHSEVEPMDMRNGVMARLELHTREHNLTYLAFRSNAIQGLLSVSTVPEPRTKGIPFAMQRGAAAEKTSADLPPLFKNRFFVESGNRFYSIDKNDIAYFFSDGRFVYFSTFSKSRYIIHYRMDQLQQLLDPTDFYRINRSYIISVKSIDQIHAYFGGRFKLKLNPAIDETVLVSRNRAAGFKKWLGD